MSSPAAPVALIRQDADHEKEVFRVPTQDVLVGDPAIAFTVLHSSSDRRRAMGRFACSVGHFRWTIVGDEVVLLEEGRLTIHWPGGSIDVGPGDTYAIDAGTVVEYEVAEPIRSTWWLVADEPLEFLP